MSRKGMFKNLPAPGSQDEEVPTAEGRLQPLLRPLVGNREILSPNAAGAVGAMAQAFGESNARFHRAELIEHKLAEGQTVVELDPSLIDPSFVRDRMPVDDPEPSLLDAIREHGQQIPILVRPKPDQPGRYQVAFGHRRLQVALTLKIPIRAIVRQLTDEQLVVAQGQENSERRDLSFIEKCRFAANLEKNSFGRSTIMAALAVNKSAVSEMLSIVETISTDIIDAIGPAPKTGKRVWMALAERLASTDFLRYAKTAITLPEFSSLQSDDRIKHILYHVDSESVSDRTEQLSNKVGKSLARIRYQNSTISITINRKAFPGFAEEAVERLKQLHQEKIGMSQ